MGLGAILIRADAGPEIGVGHVMRCLALAQVWQDHGGRAIFVMAKTTPRIEERLRAENCAVEAMLEEIGSHEDAARTNEIAQENEARWIVLDGYAFGAAYQRTIKDAAFKLLCVDDVGGSESYFPDLILNQNIHAAEDLYRNRQNYSRCLLGPRFALLRREFIKTPARRQKTTERFRILVTMGGSDPGNFATTVLESIHQVSTPLEVIIVTGPANSQAQNFDVASAGSHQIQIISNPDSMVPLMSWADVAISAAGSTVWEMCRLGLPAILVSIAENQVPGSTELGRRGIAAYLGPAKGVGSRDMAGAVMDLLHSPQRRAAMSRMGQELVDGRGSERVVDALRSLPLHIRRATQDDCWLLWQWVNDPQVRSASFESEEISREEHAAWFTRLLNSRDAAIYIAEDSGGAPVGQFRVEWNAGKNAVVDISVAQERRGGGIASSIIAEGAQIALREAGLQQLHAYIRPANCASQRAFEKASFIRVGEEPMRGQPAIHYVWEANLCN